MGEAQAGNEEVGECLFRPPLYKQRYTAAATILRDERWSKDIRKVVDLGCAELKLVQYFKTLPYIQHLVEVDIDRNTLDTYKFRAAPLTIEYLKRREQPLTIDVYQGSVAENDSSLMGADAIVCVELIEHLEPDVLEKMPKTIFGCVQPLVVVISTPNADFNPVFGECKGFRHWDHKFEWTRVEFEDWAKSVLNKYPNYTYELSGVGDPPPGSEHVGPCSQIAVFHRQYTIPSPQVVGEFYELVEHYVYPVNDDKRSEDEKIADEITYRVNSMSGDQNFHCENDEYAFVPTQMIFNLVRDSFPACTEEKFQSIAAKRFEIVENSVGVPSIRVEIHGWSSDEEQEYEDELVGQEEPFASSSAQEEEEDWNVVEQPAGLPAEEDCNEEEPKENLPEDLNGERLAPRIEVDWAIRENEENQLAESLRKNGLLRAPPAGYYDEDDDDLNDFFDADDDADRSDDDFEADFDFHRRGDDCEFMCSSLGSAPKTDTALPLEEKTEHITDSGVDLPSLRQSDFPKSTSVEVLHSDGPSSRRRAARIEYGDSATLCYTGQDRQGCPRLAESPGDADADSCSLDEPDRAADSGYPNSSSLNQEVDVDADLTPEQVDDISRSDGEPSLSEDGQSDDENAAVPARPAALPARMPLPPVFGNVENGDLANNNRDGEGNNAAPEDDIPGLPLEFAALVHEEEQQPLLAGAVAVEDEEGVLPEDADPFPAWLSDLLGLEHRDREGTVVARESGGGGGGGDASLSDTDEGLGEENIASWSGDSPTSAHV